VGLYGDILVHATPVFLRMLDCILLTIGFDFIDAARSVSIQPGWMTFDRIPQSAYAYAADRGRGRRDNTAHGPPPPATSSSAWQLLPRAVLSRHPASP
jgi:hypothetical protein